MTDAERAVIEMAAGYDRCKHDWEDSEFYPNGCTAADCLHCRAAALLPELRCACGKWQLDRSSPSLWEMPINHNPERCEAPKPPTHCSACKQTLPDTKQVQPEKSGADTRT